jgi:hypothetical protein
VTGTSFAAAVGYDRKFHPLTARDVRDTLAAMPWTPYIPCPFTLMRQALILYILTRASGPIVGGLTVTSDTDLLKGSQSADALMKAASTDDFVGVLIPEFDARRFATSAEMCLSTMMCSFAQGKERVAIRRGPRPLLTRKQYRKIFKSRFRLIFARQALTESEVQQDADDLMDMIRDMLFKGAAGLHALVCPTSKATAAATATGTLTEHQLLYADHVMCDLLLCDDMVDALQGILTAKRCFLSCHIRRGVDEGTRV